MKLLRISNFICLCALMVTFAALFVQRKTISLQKEQLATASAIINNKAGYAFAACYNPQTHLWDRCRDGMKDADGNASRVISIITVENTNGTFDLSPHRWEVLQFPGLNPAAPPH